MSSMNKNVNGADMFVMKKELTSDFNNAILTNIISESVELIRPGTFTDVNEMYINNPKDNIKYVEEMKQCIDIVKNTINPNSNDSNIKEVVVENINIFLNEKIEVLSEEINKVEKHFVKKLDLSESYNNDDLSQAMMLAEYSRLDNQVSKLKKAITESYQANIKSEVDARTLYDAGISKYVIGKLTDELSL